MDSDIPRWIFTDSHVILFWIAMDSGGFGWIDLDRVGFRYPQIDSGLQVQISVQLIMVHKSF